MSTAAAPVETPLPRSQTIVSWRAVLGIVSLLLAHLPILWRYLSGVVELPHYEFVMLLPIGAAVLAVPRWGRLGNLVPGKGATFFIWLGAGLSLLLVSIVLDSPWFGAVASLLSSAAAIYAIGGRRLLLVLLPAWCLLWLGIRLPLTADERLSQKLQEVAATRASAVLNYLEVDHILDGNVVETPTHRYMVEEACSGVQSLFAITACTVFFALWMREPIGRVLLLLLVAWWWVWLANVVRVIAVTILHSRWDLPVTEGWGHDALGMVLFGLTLGLIVSSEHLLLFFLPRGIFSGKDKLERHTSKNQQVDHGPTRLPDLGKTWLASPALVVVCMVFVVLQWLPQLNAAPPTATPVTLDGITMSLAPASFEGWTLLPDEPDAVNDEVNNNDGYSKKQRRDDSQWGARSQTWHYRKGSRDLIVSIDFPFRGWHELTICYRADGWNMKSRKVVDIARPASASGVIGTGEKCVETVMERPELGSHSYLVFTSFNDRQEALAVAEQLSIVQRLKDRLNGFWERIRTLGRSGGGRDDQVQSYQLQVLFQGQTTPNLEDSREAMALFVEMRARLGQFLAQQSAGEVKP